MLRLFQAVHVIAGQVSELVSHPLLVMLMLIKVGIVGVYVMFKWGYSAICSFKKLHSLQGRKRTICLLFVCRCCINGGCRDTSGCCWNGQPQGTRWRLQFPMCLNCL